MGKYLGVENMILKYKFYNPQVMFTVIKDAKVFLEIAFKKQKQII